MPSGEPPSSAQRERPPRLGGDILDSAAAGPAAIRGGLLRTAAFVTGLGLMLASAPLVVRHLGDVDFGRYSTVLAITLIFGGLTEGGVNTVALRDLSAAADSSERSRLTSDLLGLRLVLSTVGVCAAASFSALAGYGTDLVAGTVLAGLGLTATMTQTLLATVLQSRLRFGWAAAVELIRQATTAALLAALVLADAGVVVFLGTSVPAGLLALGVTVSLVRGSVGLRPAFHPRRWTPLLRETAVFAIAIAVNSLFLRITLVITALVATAAETGYFAISFRIMEVLVVVPMLLVSAAFPILARTARADRERFYIGSGRLFALALFVGSLGALCLILVAPFAIEVLTGDRGHPSVAVLQIQSGALLASFLASATGYPLLGMHRHREALIANLTSLVVVVALALVLASELGAQGAAIAAVVGDFTLAAATTVLLTRGGGPRLPLAAIPVSIVAAVGGYAVGAGLPLHPLLQAGAGVTVFLGIHRALGLFPSEIGELARGILRARSS